MTRLSGSGDKYRRLKLHIFFNFPTKRLLTLSPDYQYGNAIEALSHSRALP